MSATLTTNFVAPVGAWITGSALVADPHGRGRTPCSGQRASPVLNLDVRATQDSRDRALYEAVPAISAGAEPIPITPASMASGWTGYHYHKDLDQEGDG